MKVLLINRNDFVDGGADRVFMNTYDLLQVAGYGLQVGKFTRKDAGLDQAADPRGLSGWGKLLLVKDYLYNRKAARSLENKIREFKPDVAHVHLIFGTLSVSVLTVLKKCRVPVVMTVHDYRLICPANAMLDRNGKICERCRGKQYFNCLIHRCSEGNFFFSAVITLEAYLRKFVYKPLKLVDHFIFVSQFAKNKHLEFEPRYALKSTHLYNMNASVHDNPVTRGDYFLYFGRISREKGLLTLISAAETAGVRLVIAGTGPQEEDLRRLLDDKTLRRGDEETGRGGEEETGRGGEEETGRGGEEETGRGGDRERIEMVGYKTGIELEDLIRNCSFTVVPSEWYENNPMSVVESFSLGKPVIGSDIGGIPELVTADNGFLFESGNRESLADVLRRAAGMADHAYDNMCSACLDFARKNFDRSLHARSLTQIYEQVTNRL